MHDEVYEDEIDTQVNFWPALVDAVSSVLALMFLLYIAKGVASGEMEAIRARRAMAMLQAALERRFHAAGLDNVVRCQYSTNLLRVTFSDAVLFNSGEYKVPPRGQRVLNICAETLRRPDSPPYEQIQVEGHTDSHPMQRPGYPHDNWELSSARAVAVLKELMQMGVRPEVISANGYADQVKIDRGTGEEADKKNRRIELRIIYSIPKLSARAGQ